MRFEPRAGYEIYDCVAQCVCITVLCYAGLIILVSWRRVTLGRRSSVKFKHSPGLKDGDEPIASVAAPLEIRRSNLKSYNCLINSNGLLKGATEV